MKKHLFFIIVGCLFTLTSSSIAIYTDSSLRHSVLSLLTGFDRGNSINHSYVKNESSLLAQLGASPMLSLPNNTLATDTSASSTAVVASSSVTNVSKGYQYKLVRSVDPCTLNRLGRDNWQPIQFGGNLDIIYGLDENCKNPKGYDTLDWVLFSRPIQ